ncbi:cyclic nucleotide-gated ion channel 1-like [Pyrus ussuriensis x Pyrus communis]|uniref:Cyclic nucleotide-gated ion channel 1-like n=1 Tax=Pyrus ussuriensis x Pyrus communis TaxID=2448454 RepID=A0A5N5HPE5_9ROSA|nr:cyclic nucleotide-gated ion channel 1-like [Pyrus ussuriensis x Pyrus communis]
MGMAKSSSAGRLCKIVFFCFAALLAIILATALSWTLLRDAKLSPEFPEFLVDLVAVSPCPLTAASSSEYLTATWDLTLVAINPNRKLEL